MKAFNIKQENLVLILKDRWREEENEKTREILGKMNLISFLIEVDETHTGCNFHHIDGKWGYLTIEDAMIEQWNIYDQKTDILLGTYDSVEDLIENGWKVMR